MRVQAFRTEVVQWTDLPQEASKGTSGEAKTASYATGKAMMRLVSYSPCYQADHWCTKGHLLLVIEGELVVEEECGTKYVVGAGTSCVLPDSMAAHRVYSIVGALVFIVD